MTPDPGVPIRVKIDRVNGSSLTATGRLYLDGYMECEVQDKQGNKVMVCLDPATVHVDDPKRLIKLDTGKFTNMRVAAMLLHIKRKKKP